MERVNQFPLYELGKDLAKVAAYVGDIPAATAFWDLVSARAAISGLLNGKPFPVTISRTAAQTLWIRLSEIWDAHFQADKPDGTKEFRFPPQNAPPIEVSRWNAVRYALTQFDPDSPDGFAFS